MERKKRDARATISVVSYKKIVTGTDDLPETTEKSDLVAQIIGVGGLIATIVGGSIVSLTAFPLVDYSAYTQNSSQVTVNVRNIGFNAAKNVVVSLHADRANFSNLTAEPYISEEFKKEITSSGDAYGKLAILAPRASVNITGVFKSNNGSDVTITPYVFSDEVLGKVNSLWTVIFYIILAAIYSILFIIMYFGVGIAQLDPRRGIVVSILAVVIYAAIFLALYNVIAIIPTYSSSSPALPT